MPLKPLCGSCIILFFNRSVAFCLTEKYDRNYFIVFPSNRTRTNRSEPIRTDPNRSETVRTLRERKFELHGTPREESSSVRWIFMKNLAILSVLQSALGMYIWLVMQ